VIPARRDVRKLALAALILVATPSIYAADLGTGFTYQGQLKQGGLPLSGTADFQFTLWDAAGSGNPPTGGTQVGGVQAVTAVPVTAGLFTVTLNAGGEFGSDAFNGSTRWLQVAVRYPTITSNSFTTLAPRQPITATPYALRAAQGVGPPGFLEVTPTGQLILTNRLLFDADNWTIAALTDEGTAPLTIESRNSSGDKTKLRIDDANSSVTIMGQLGPTNTAGITPPPKLVVRLVAAEANTAGITVGGGVSIAAYDYYGETAVPLRLKGKVGIGIDDPSERLDVAGNIHASGTITSGNTITIDGTSGSENISSSASLDLRTAAGRALRLENNATSPNLIGGYSGNTVTAGVVGATIGGGGDFGGKEGGAGPNRVTDDFGAVGGGRGNQAGAYATVGGGIGNSATGYSSTVGGGSDNTASADFSTFGGGVANTATGYISTIGGGFNNTASGASSTIGGGVSNMTSNGYSTVGGGHFNTVSGFASTVGGGVGNTASNEYSTVGGGISNMASGYISTIGGGESNTASGLRSTVGGGYSNAASGLYSTVPGGVANQAGGDYSFAAGQRAKVRDPISADDADGDEGTFVWADSTIGNFISTGPNQFLVRASGGMWFGTTSAPSIPQGRFINTSTGGYLTTGGVWTDSSDREAKENFARLDRQTVLDSLANVSISRWNFKVQDASVQHIGPTAQDFHAAFDTGEDDKHLAALDTAGVALAAIQGLYEIVQDKDCEIGELQNREAAKDQRINELEARLTAIEALLARGFVSPPPE
jgi:hypothetical protein